MYFYNLKWGLFSGPSRAFWAKCLRLLWLPLWRWFWRLLGAVAEGGENGTAASKKAERREDFCYEIYKYNIRDAKSPARLGREERKREKITDPKQTN
jgi:hypothetical protein